MNGTYVKRLIYVFVDVCKLFTCETGAHGQLELVIFNNKTKKHVENHLSPLIFFVLFNRNYFSTDKHPLKKHHHKWFQTNNICILWKSHKRPFEFS